MSITFNPSQVLNPTQLNAKRLYDQAGQQVNDTAAIFKRNQGNHKVNVSDSPDVVTVTDSIKKREGSIFSGEYSYLSGSVQFAHGSDKVVKADVTKAGPYSETCEATQDGGDRGLLTTESTRHGTGVVEHVSFHQNPDGSITMEDLNTPTQA